MMKNEMHSKTKKKVLGVFNQCADEILHEEELKSRKPSQDTLDRKEVHKVIQQMVYEKKGKIEILNYLSNHYPDAQCSIYFSQWIDYYENRQNQHHKVEKAVESEER